MRHVGAGNSGASSRRDNFVTVFFESAINKLHENPAIRLMGFSHDC